MLVIIRFVDCYLYCVKRDRQVPVIGKPTAVFRFMDRKRKGNSSNKS
jgi:hypothetical protein